MSNIFFRINMTPNNPNDVYIHNIDNIINGLNFNDKIKEINNKEFPCNKFKKLIDTNLETDFSSWSKNSLLYKKIEPLLILIEKWIYRLDIVDKLSYLWSLPDWIIDSLIKIWIESKWINELLINEANSKLEIPINNESQIHSRHQLTKINNLRDNLELLLFLFKFAQINNNINWETLIDLLYIISSPKIILNLTKLYALWVKIQMSNLKNCKDQILLLNDDAFVNKIEQLATMWVDVDIKDLSDLKSVSDKDLNILQKNKDDIIKLTDYQVPKVDWNRPSPARIRWGIRFSCNKEDIIKLFLLCKTWVFNYYFNFSDWISNRKIIENNSFLDSIIVHNKELKEVFENETYKNRLTKLIRVYDEQSIAEKLFYKTSVENKIKTPWDTIKKSIMNILNSDFNFNNKKDLRLDIDHKDTYYTFTPALLEIVKNDKFDNLIDIFSQLKWYKLNFQKIYLLNIEKLNFLCQICDYNNEDIIKVMIAYSVYDLKPEFMEFLENEKIDNFKQYLIKFCNNENANDKQNKYINELVLLSKEFWIKPSKVITKRLYDTNIEMSLLNKSSRYMLSTDEYIQKLVDTWFLNWNINGENILELWALLSLDFFNWNPDIKKEIDRLKSEKDIGTYKKIIRALNDYIYINYFGHLDRLSLLFSSIYNSEFLRCIYNLAYKPGFNYMYQKKVRFQDMERAYNSCPDIFRVNMDNKYYKLCVDYAIENNDYNYLWQNLETVKNLIDMWYSSIWEMTNFVNPNKTSESYQNFYTEDEIKKYSDLNTFKNYIDPKYKDYKKLFEQTLKKTGGFITTSIMIWLIRDKRNLEDLIEENKEAKKQVISWKSIDIKGDALYEAIYYAYKPTNIKISKIKEYIESGKVSDHQEHLKAIQYNEAGYEMDFFTRDYELVWKQDDILLSWIDWILWEEISESSIIQWLNLKTFFPTATNLFSKSNSKREDWKIESVTEINQWIFDILQKIYSFVSSDWRIKEYKSNNDNSNYSFNRLSNLNEIFSVVTKDNFLNVFWTEINKLTEEEKEKLWKNIWKIKDKRVRSKYEEIDNSEPDFSDKLSSIFMWRLLEYAKIIRKYIHTEMKKYKKIKWNQKNIKAKLTKDVWSFFAKAWAWLCTSEDFGIWNEKRHIHLNLIDEEKWEIIWNIMLYFEEWRNYLIARWFNPTIDTENSYDVNQMTDEMIRVVKEIAVKNWYVDENWDALVYVPPHNSYHALSNREKMRKRILHLVSLNKWEKNSEIKNANFYAKEIWTKWISYFETLFKL